MCGSHRQTIKGITIAGHGTNISFRIGVDVITKASLDPKTAHPEKRHIYPALMSIKPLFEIGAWIRIDACQSGSDQGLLKKLSEVLGVTVLAWTGDQSYEQIGNDISVTRKGYQVVCVSARCEYF
jgi:hypothetical protein